MSYLTKYFIYLYFLGEINVETIIILYIMIIILNNNLGKILKILVLLQIFIPY